ncbi:MAG: hypothetical protein NZ805_15740 [Armatimonadetes bacterium]|nr:hypothetical protein [Armatimonadota bacterium]
MTTSKLSFDSDDIFVAQSVSDPSASTLVAATQTYLSFALSDNEPLSASFTIIFHHVGTGVSLSEIRASFTRPYKRKQNLRDR